MRFAGAGWPESKAVLASVDPLAARQFQNQRLIQRRLGGEVERIEALGLRKARQPNATLYVTTLAIDALQFAHARTTLFQALRRRSRMASIGLRIGGASPTTQRH